MKIMDAAVRMRFMLVDRGLLEDFYSRCSQWCGAEFEQKLIGTFVVSARTNVVAVFHAFGDDACGNAQRRLAKLVDQIDLGSLLHQKLNELVGFQICRGM